MSHSDSLSKLEATLETMQSLTGRMKESSGIHQIDIDLLQQKTRELYEQILVLEPHVHPPLEEKKEVSFEEEESLASPELEYVAPSPAEEKIIEEEEVELEEAKNEIVEQEPENVEPEPVVDENIQEEVSEEESIDEKPEGPVNEAEEEPIAEMVKNHEEVYEDVMIERASNMPPQEEPAEPGTKSTLDLFSEAQDDSLATVLQKSNQPNLGEKLEHSHVRDLREGIGINDKFQFINELFNGDMDQYNKVLDELNSFSSLQGAQTYLSEMSVQYDFSKTGMAFQKLKALLDKKYV